METLVYLVAMAIPYFVVSYLGHLGAFWLASKFGASFDGRMMRIALYVTVIFMGIGFGFGMILALIGGGQYV